MNLLVSLCNVSVLVNPDESILNFLASLCWLMDSNIDMQFRLLGFFLETQYEFAFLY